MMAPFADMPRKEGTLAWSLYRSSIKQVTEGKGGFKELFFFILPMYYFHLIQKSQVDNFTFDCVVGKHLKTPFVRIYSADPV